MEKPYRILRGMINIQIHISILTNCRYNTDRETLVLILGTMENQLGVLTQTVRNFQMKKAQECTVPYSFHLLISDFKITDFAIGLGRTTFTLNNTKWCNGFYIEF